MTTSVSPVDADRVRHRVRITGVVQGVGFRPFVHRLAAELQLGGWVTNDADGVLAHVEGPPGAVACFEARLVEQAPPLARVVSVTARDVEPLGEAAFRINPSPAGANGAGGRTYVSPDMAVCSDCLAEMWDPADRRYRYPFINCTNCGPRFTITLRLPYDRPNTTMRDFPLCPACEAEYRDPGNRRFHAQPIACDACGPRIWFEPGEAGGDSAVAAAQRLLAGGGIVAIKGIGGYHLACDATNESAVRRLRQRKGRAAKPLAVMVAGLDAAGELALVGSEEAALLSGPERPIVLLRRSGSSHLASSVAPENPYLGLLLPYSPLHHLLFAPVPGCWRQPPQMLVMTSGNLSDEPICFEYPDAVRRLGRVADGWLTHDRPIHVPCDDSVVRLDGGNQLPVRRSRGYAPLPIRLPFPVPALIAAGGELKNTFCVASGPDAWVSQHIGDMGSLETLDAFERSVDQMCRLYAVRAGTVAADAHPGYQTRAWSERRAEPVSSVQHHHAHIAALMAEHGLGRDQRVIGFAFDGTGYGADGAIWGGEALVAGYGHYRRAAHLRYAPLPGGDAAIRKPYRTALAHLWAAGVPWTVELPPVQAASPAELTTLARQLERNVQCVPTSSMGRLFDAVSSLLGVRHVVSYEAQAAMEMEAVAETGSHAPRDYRFAVIDGEVDSRPVVAGIVDDVRAGCPAGPIAAGFHAAVANLIADVAVDQRARTGIEQVALSGGVFQNLLLVGLARRRLTEHGFRVLTHRVVPPNDGGLALGQAAIAGWATRP